MAQLVKFSEQEWKPEVDPQNQCKNLGVTACTCNSRAGDVETGESLDLSRHDKHQVPLGDSALGLGI